MDFKDANSNDPCTRGLPSVDLAPTYSQRQSVIEALPGNLSTKVNNPLLRVIVSNQPHVKLSLCRGQASASQGLKFGGLKLSTTELLPIVKSVVAIPNFLQPDAEVS